MVGLGFWMIGEALGALLEGGGLRVRLVCLGLWGIFLRLGVFWGGFVDR